MPDISFRTQLTPADPAAIRALVVRAGVFSEVECGWAQDLAREALDSPATADLHFLMRDDAMGLLAYACFGPIEGTDGRFDLYWIAVDPKAQGLGLGRALLDGAVAAARRLGCAIMYIETSTRPDYAPARGLYRACGFALAAELPDFYRDGDGKAIFARRL